MKCKKISTIIVIIALFFVFGCIKNSTNIGRIQGNMIIEKSCIENNDNCNIPENELQKIYSKRKIIIYGAEDTDKVMDIQPDETGKFSAEILPGEYFIDINYDNFDYALDLPKQITIEENKTTTVDVNIEIQQE